MNELSGFLVITYFTSESSSEIVAFVLQLSGNSFSFIFLLFSGWSFFKINFSWKVFCFLLKSISMFSFFLEMKYLPFRFRRMRVLACDVLICLCYLFLARFWARSFRFCLRKLILEFHPSPILEKFYIYRKSLLVRL